MAAANVSLSRRSTGLELQAASTTGKQNLLQDTVTVELLPRYLDSLSTTTGQLPAEQVKNSSGLNTAIASQFRDAESKQTEGKSEEADAIQRAKPVPYLESQLEQLLSCLKPLSIYATTPRPPPPMFSSVTYLDTEANIVEFQRSYVPKHTTNTDDNDPFSIQIRDVKTPVAEAGQWFFDHHDYQDWRGPMPQSRVLLLLAGPGLGKTVLMKHLTERLSSELGSRNVVAFFCKSDITERESGMSIVASFVYKLLDVNYRNIVAQGSLSTKEASSVLGRYILGQRSTLPDRITFDLLWRFFLELSGGLCGDDFVFILDGWNECTTKTRRELETALISSRKEMIPKFIITSQPNSISPALQEHFKTISITGSGLSQALRSYVSHKLEDEGIKVEINHQALELILQAVTEGVGGMFLLVSCRVEEICRRFNDKELETNEAYINRIIQQPYAPVMQYFASMLNQAAKESLRPRSACILNLLLAAQEPLFNAELVPAYMLSRFNFKTYNALSEDKRNSVDLLSEARNLFAPILEIIESKNGRLLQLTHEQVHLFLDSGPQESFSKDLNALLNYVNSQRGHMLMAKACLQYLLYPEMCKDDAHHFHQHPFCLYALKYWPHHIAKSGGSVSEYSQELAEFLSASTTGYGFWGRFIAARSEEIIRTTVTPWLPIAITLVEYEMTNVLDELVPLANPSVVRFHTCEINLEQIDSRKRTALLVAMFREDYISMNKLLELGVNPNVLDSAGIGPLHFAARLRLPEVIQILCDHKANANVEQAAKDNPLLFWAFDEDEDYDDTNDAKLDAEEEKSVLTFEALHSRGARHLIREVDQFSVLHQAARLCNLRLVKHILQSKLVDVDSPCIDGSTPVLEAASAPQTNRALEVVRYLVLEHDASLNILSHDGRFALWEALRAGNEQLAAFILNHMEHGEVGLLEARSSQRWECLHLCVSAGFLDIATRLVEYGANLDAKLKSNITPLQLALNEQKFDIAIRLIKLGADVNVREDDGEFPLYRSCIHGQVNVVKELLMAEADTLMTCDSKSALMMACWFNYPEVCDVILSTVNEEIASILLHGKEKKSGWTPLLIALYRKNVTIARRMIKAGADCDAISASGHTALHMVQYCGDDELFNEVLSRSPKTFIDRRAANGMTPLAAAARNGFVKAVETLLAQGADPKTVDEDSETLLIHAAISGSSETLELLLDNGKCSANQRNRSNATALHYAARHPLPKKIVQRLVQVMRWQRNPRSVLTPMDIAVLNGNASTVEILLECGMPADSTDNVGLTPLYRAVVLGESSIAVTLIEAGADITITTGSNVLPYCWSFEMPTENIFPRLRPIDTTDLKRRSDTDLSNAILDASKASLDEVIWLVENGVQPDILDIYSFTALHHAAATGKHEILDYLIDQPRLKPLLNQRVFLSQTTPLIAAAQARSPECIRVLVGKGEPDFTHEDVFGNSALVYASRHQATLAALLSTSDTPAPIQVRSRLQNRENQVKNWIEKLLGMVARIRSLEKVATEPWNYRTRVLCYVSQFLLLLEDLDNALTAWELCEGPPASTFNGMQFCDVCKRRKRGRFGVCTSCPWVTMCMQCKDEQSQLDEFGCSTHTIALIPRDHWFERKPTYVNAEGQTEEQWLDTLELLYQHKYQQICRQQQQDPKVNFADGIELWEYADLKEDPFQMLESNSLDDLREHLLRFPRNVTLKTKSGNDLVMHAILSAATDERCLSHLQFLRFEGFRILTNNGEVSSVVLACRKNFEESTTFLLSQYDDFFNQTEDRQSTEALNHIIDKTWDKALAFAIEHHFRWASGGAYSFLEDLDMLDFSDEMIVDFLKQNPLLGESKTEPIHAAKQFIFHPFIRTGAAGHPKTDFHADSCIHRLFSARTISNRANSRSPLVAPDLELDWDNISLNSENQDEDSRSSENLDAVEELSSASTASSITTRAAYLCGFGGIASLHDGSVTPVPSQFGLTTVKLTYRLEDSSQSSIQSTFDIVSMAGRGLLQAIHAAQNTNICCDFFTILHATYQTDTSSRSSTGSLVQDHGPVVVRLSKISFSLVSDLVENIETAMTRNQLQENMEFISRCLSSASRIREICRFPTEPVSTDHTNMLSYICQTVQILCIGFLSFLGGHSSQIRLPFLSTAFPYTIICGTGASDGIAIGPRRMACIGDMLRMDLLVFCRHISETSDIHSSLAGFRHKREEYSSLFNPKSSGKDLPHVSDLSKEQNLSQTLNVQAQNLEPQLHLTKVDTDESITIPDENSMPHNLAHDANACFIVATIEDVLQIWGPGDCVFKTADKDDKSIVVVAIRRGYISLTSQVVAGYRLAHWYDEEIIEEEGYNWLLPTSQTGHFIDGHDFLQGKLSSEMSTPLLSFLPTEEIIFGGLVKNCQCPVNHREMYEKAKAAKKIRYLDTNPPHFRLQSNQVSATAGYHFNIGGNRVYERKDHDTKKDLILNHWKKSNKKMKSGRRWNPDDFAILSEPFGLLFSPCSSFAKRVPLRVAVAEVWWNFALQHLPQDNQKERAKLFLREAQIRLSGQRLDSDDQTVAMSPDEALNRFISLKRSEVQLLVHSIILEILESLSSSGVSSDGNCFKIAWPIETDRMKGYIFACNEVRESWIRLVQDTSDLATFAFVTKDCLIEDRGYPIRCKNHDDSVPDLSALSVLDTKIRITSEVKSVDLRHGFCYITSAAPRNSLHTSDLELACKVRDRGPSGVDLVVIRLGNIIVPYYSRIIKGESVQAEELYENLDPRYDVSRPVYLTANQWWRRN